MNPNSAPEWKITLDPIEYEAAMELMKSRVEAIQNKLAPEMVWLLEHQPLFTLGTSADRKEILNAGEIPLYSTGRGGKVTYHGPGQRVAYVLLDLKKRNPDVRAYVKSLEEWVIQSLLYFGIEAERREGRIGLWVLTPEGEKKIAAIGIRIQKWVTSHGLALNVNPDLSAYSKIIPCGIQNYGVTSMAELGVTVSLEDVDAVLKTKFREVFSLGNS